MVAAVTLTATATGYSVGECAAALGIVSAATGTTTVTGGTGTTTTTGGTGITTTTGGTGTTTTSGGGGTTTTTGGGGTTTVSGGAGGTAAAGTPSPDGLHADVVVDAAGNTWTFGGSLGITALRNGSAPANGGGVQFLKYGTDIFTRADANHWWRFNGSIWVDTGTTDPALNATWPLLGIAGVTSPSGTVMDGTNNYSFYDYLGRKWTVGGNGFQTLRDGVIMGGSGNIVLWYNNQVYIKGYDGNWYVWTGAVMWPFPPNSDPRQLPHGTFPTTFTAPTGYAGGPGTSTTPTAPAEVTPNAIAPGSSGTTITVAPTGAQYSTISAAVAAAAAGDTITIAAGTYNNETFSNTVPVKIVGAGAATTIIDCTGLGVSGLANSRGCISPKSDIWVEGLTIRNVYSGTTDTVAAIRPGGGCTVWTKNLIVHHCFMGLFSGDGYAVNWFSDHDTIHDCGMGDGFTHNIYFSRGVVKAEFTSLDSNTPTGGHALKCRAVGYTKCTNCTLSASDGFPLDVPDGSFYSCAIAGTTLTKPTGSPNHTILAYAEETGLNGTAGMTMTGCTFNSPDNNANIRNGGGTIAITSSTFNGTVTQGAGTGTITGLPA